MAEKVVSTWFDLDKFSDDESQANWADWALNWVEIEDSTLQFAKDGRRFKPVVKEDACACIVDCDLDNVSAVGNDEGQQRDDWDDSNPTPLSPHVGSVFTQHASKSPTLSPEFQVMTTFPGMGRDVYFDFSTIARAPSQSIVLHPASAW
ncbi:hypothetical protein EDC04DRAFT_2611855 [Pisolithus marmoratus]|nr:hypothetical protein EDC04DRAFT_2611855 [Pisolithus marmoratus]